MIREAIAKLVERKPIGRNESYEVLQEIMKGEATPAQIAAFLTALRFHGETPEIIAGAAQAMREHFTPVAAPNDRAVDTCGTGGDGRHTFNISTAAAFVAAGAGAVVAKHGNRSVSSRCGSADVLASLGVNVQAPPAVMEACLREIGIAFLFAPTLHPAMKHAIGPRREIGIRTIFNILGPLSNPARARFGVLGVYSADLVPVMAQASLDLGAEHLFVVHGLDGLDEITLTAPTLIAEVSGGTVRTQEWTPEDFGLPRGRTDDLAGGTPEENAATVRRILDGEKGPKRDIVVVNAAAALVACNLKTGWPAAIEAAAAAIDSGAAREKLERLAQRTAP